MAYRPLLVFFKKAPVLAIAFCLLLTTRLAWAGPPFVTDDPETPPWHGWEINIPLTLERTRDEREIEMPLFDLNYGYKPNVQLKLEFPLLSVDRVGGGRARGLGDTLIGVKWRFREESRRRPQLALYPQVVLPTGDSQRGLGSGKPSYILPLLAQKGWGRLTLYGNLGYVVQTAAGSRDFWYHGLTLMREVTDRLEVGAEVFGNSATGVDGHSELGFNVGGTWKVREGRVLLFSVGRNLQGEARTMLYLGLQILTRGSEE